MSEDANGREFLAEWLKRHKVRQIELARRVGVTPGTISKILKGLTRPGMPLVFLIELATSYNADGSKPVPVVEAMSWLTREEMDRAEELDRARLMSIRVTKDQLMVAEATQRSLHYRSYAAWEEAARKDATEREEAQA